MADIYLNCDAVIDGPFPRWITCGKKVNNEGQAVPRCAEHPVKRLWPADDETILFGNDGPKRTVGFWNNAGAKP